MSVLMALVVLAAGLARAQPWISPDFPVRLGYGAPQRLPPAHLLPEPTVCRYCLCDQHTLTVTCASAHLRLKTLVLPQWAEIFHAYNVSVTEFPHFTYHPALKVVRVSHCGLRHLHPLSFIPLPNLETIHLADNEIEEIPETLFRRLVHLRVINLSRNKIRNLASLQWSLSDGLVLEQLHLDDNPIQLGQSVGLNREWPRVKQLTMSKTNVIHLNATHIVFKDSAICIREACRTLHLTPDIWKVMTSLDLSDNPNLHLDRSSFQPLSNLTLVRLAGCPLPLDVLTWLDAPSTRVRHLDLNDARFDVQVKKWSFCAPSLEWLDISGVGIEQLVVQTKCSSLQWLYAERNNLEVASIRAHALVGLHLRTNRLQSWPLPVGDEEVPFSQLTYLSLANNLLDQVPAHAFKSTPNLEILDLSSNRLTALNRGVLPTVDLKLRSLNLSGNYLERFRPPILPNLAVLDLSANNLDGLENEFWLALPLLQRLHLAFNPPTMTVDWHSAGARHATQLMELDMSHSELRQIPPLDQLQHLRSLRLDGNQVVYMDGARLPGCLMSLSIARNQVHFLGNFTEDQFACLKELDLSRNPLKCDCSLAVLSPVLEHQAGYTDRTQYYCFADSWQHPLKAYVESARFCNAADDSDRFTPLLLNFVGILAVFVALAAFVAFVLLRICSALSKRVMPFAYKPVVQSDLAVDL